MTEEQAPPPQPQDRRNGVDRRADDADGVKADQRSGDDRRRQPDRRGSYLSIRYTGPEAVDELRQWLRANCEGEFTIGIPNTEAAEAWGHFRVRFESQKDLARLAKLLSVHWPSWMG